MFKISENEEKILKFWDKNKVFQQTLKKRKGAKSFVFFEGPPGPNGPPHIGHFLTRAYKDLFNRYKTMRGFYVLRKAGWDTHGLPIEIQTEKELGFKNKKDIERFGVAKFNQKAKELTWRYQDEWERFTKRTGFWLDLNDPYITYSNEYMETLWWIIKQIHGKGSLYRDLKVVPYCARCGTALSIHAVESGYKKIKEKTIYAKFKIKGQENTYALVWTTTPWTLPGNLLLAVNKKVIYVKVKVGNEFFILAKNRLPILEKGYEIIDEKLGGEIGKLIGQKSVFYDPPFDFVEYDQEVNFITTKGSFVKDDEGTGIVHIAPAFGEDDFALCKKLNLNLIQIVDADGKYINTHQIKSGYLAGKFVKDADELIIDDLEKRGLIFRTEDQEHDYPFCWRCNTPLIYYAKNSWFIKISALKNQLIKNNEKVNWVPVHMKMGRFGNWLREIQDWTLSRERYWGTPLPVWECGSCAHYEVIGSLQELNDLRFVPSDSLDKRRGTQKNYPFDERGNLNLHRPYIDSIFLSCKKCGGQMQRVEEVMDVWFDSGSMPYAQWHYPFENKNRIDGASRSKQFPADFVVEGVDQTRGWFYVLLAVATLLGKGAPYKNVISLGLVLDEKGEKMSKSKGNVVDPWLMIDRYGNDTLRWHFYKLNPAGESKRFSEKEIAQTQRDFVMTLLNVVRFYELYAKDKRYISTDKIPHPKNILDEWLLSRLNSLIKKITNDLESYDATTASRSLENFVVEDLSKWWLRRSRGRFQNFKNREEFIAAVNLLRMVLLDISKLIAPFTPFLGEIVYQGLYKQKKSKIDSVHFCDWPQIQNRLASKSVEQKMDIVRTIVGLGLMQRKNANIKVRQPLAKITVNHKPLEKSFSSLIEDELNVKSIEFSGTNRSLLSVELDTQITAELRREGLVREFIRQVQDARKEAGYSFDQSIFCYWLSDDKEVVEAIDNYHDFISKKTLIEKLIKSTDGFRQEDLDVKKDIELEPGKKISFGLES
ncbi:MAG: isoleucine--tRNA ligase [Candidatus Brennerbacteria bacterium]|nr:isoleucine--tRNA ligase [Candidatus Brennerbacteria bacterium]